MTGILQFRLGATVGLSDKRFVDGELANRYLHGPLVDQLLVDERVDASESLSRWVLTDHQGTVRDLAVRDAISGEILISNHRVFDAFGNLLSETAGGETTIFGYAGREWEEVADLQFNRARWYDPTIGRWISQDPIGFAAGDANLYRYVGNGVTTKVDPSGLTEWDLSIAIHKPGDTVTAISAWWNFHSHDVHIEINPQNQNWEHYMNLLQSFIDRGGQFPVVTFSGHGSPGILTGVFNSANIQDPNSPQYQFLSLLSQGIAPDGHIHLAHCNVAGNQSGLDFIQQMADLTQANVIAYDDWYAVTPHGNPTTGMR